ncbi:hypothetical protein K3495_g14053 [Podosphaera aphanis]|nr:hypothetical protein K3495_g14053 [Podosphaera aphanis]
MLTLLVTSQKEYGGTYDHVISNSNSDVCGRSHVWREQKKGLLRPLPIPDRFNSEIGIDFMTDLPARTIDDARYMMVVVDRLKKSVALEEMTSMKAEDCAKVFLKLHVRHHGFPVHITSDRGSNWAGDFWTELCRLTGMKQRLSTAFHPQTDGATERMNQEILAYLRSFVTYTQFDWKDLLPCAMLAINNRTSSAMGMSPIFAEHGSHVEPIQQVEEIGTPSEPAKRAQIFVKRLREAEKLAQAAMASAQHRMEEYSNRSRKEAEQFREGGLVWLTLRNIETLQLSKKLAWMNAKYKVIKVVDSHSVELNTPTGIWPRFHVDLLKRAATDPLPSQIIDDAQPPPVLPEEQNGLLHKNHDEVEPEQFVERILRAENRKIGRGYRRLLLVKWRGFAEPTWEPRINLEETEALDKFEAQYGNGDNFHHTAHPVTGEKPSQTDTIDWAKETLGINVSQSQISKWASNLFKHLGETQNQSLPTSKRHYKRNLYDLELALYFRMKYYETRVPIIGQALRVKAGQLFKIIVTGRARGII